MTNIVWLPIETAPRDGTEFLGWCDGKRVVVAYKPWCEGVRSQIGYDGAEYWLPTHWQPLPEPPK